MLHLNQQTFCMLKITIPKPCSENWEAMTPNLQGRHCTACAKTVVDFTLMSDEEVKQFFLHQKEEKVCGRFKQEQLHRIIITLPSNILQITMPRWKQFLTACLLAFSSMLFSCDATIDQNTKVLGEPLPEIKAAVTRNTPVAFDNTKAKPDTIIKTSCSTLTGDTILADGIAAGTPVIEITQPAASKDSFEIFLTGKTVLDSNATLPSIPIVDSVKEKNPPKADSANCNNIKYY
jgi:hypothetical protein